MAYQAPLESGYSSVQWCDGRGLPRPTANGKQERRQLIVAQELRIVLVDDDLNFRKAFRTILHDDYGATVDIIDCGEDALAVPLEQYDVIFIDVTMPGINGLVVCERLRDRHAGVVMALMSTNPEYEVTAKEYEVLFYDKMDTALLEDILLYAVKGHVA
jgi:CheY-like chemotaxis protein